MVLHVSLFFSLVGTVLGVFGPINWKIWGWDAKENGALLIVIRNAMLLHARWSGIAKIEEFAIAILGNVVTAWSWFGTNMLGLGPLLWFYGQGVQSIDVLYP